MVVNSKGNLLFQQKPTKMKYFQGSRNCPKKRWCPLQSYSRDGIYRPLKTYSRDGSGFLGYIPKNPKGQPLLLRWPEPLYGSNLPRYGENAGSRFNIHSGNLTWQWKMDPLKMYFLLNMGIFRCYVSLPGGIFIIGILSIRNSRVFSNMLQNFMSLPSWSCVLSKKSDCAYPVYRSLTLPTSFQQFFGKTHAHTMHVFIWYIYTYI